MGPVWGIIHSSHFDCSWCISDFLYSKALKIPSGGYGTGNICFTVIPNIEMGEVWVGRKTSSVVSEYGIMCLIL